MLGDSFKTSVSRRHIVFLNRYLVMELLRPVVITPYTNHCKYLIFDKRRG